METLQRKIGTTEDNRAAGSPADLVLHEGHVPPAWPWGFYLPHLNVACFLQQFARRHEFADFSRLIHRRRPMVGVMGVMQLAAAS